jgi:hypothetical protein
MTASTAQAGHPAAVTAFWPNPIPPQLAAYDHTHHCGMNTSRVQAA